MMILNPDHWIFLYFITALVALTFTSMHQCVPHTVHTPLSKHGTQGTDSSATSKYESCDNDFDSYEDMITECDHGTTGADDIDDHCVCANADGSNRFQRVKKVVSSPPRLAAEYKHCTNQVPGLETICSCKCSTCRVRSHMWTSVINVDPSHLNVTILVNVEVALSMFRPLQSCTDA